MKKIAIASILAFASLSANAQNFDFSYTFGDSQVVTGSLSGDLVGSMINNISNIQVAFNGVQFATDASGSLYSAGWDGMNYTGAAVVSTNAALNNFIFADSNVAASDWGTSNYFTFTNDATYGSVVYADNLNNGELALDGESYGSTPVSASNWSITAVTAPVPEPAEGMLLLSGLAMMGFIARRRQG